MFDTIRLNFTLFCLLAPLIILLVEQEAEKMVERNPEIQKLRRKVLLLKETLK